MIKQKKSASDALVYRLTHFSITYGWNPNLTLILACQNTLSLRLLSICICEQSLHTSPFVKHPAFKGISVTLG